MYSQKLEAEHLVVDERDVELFDEMNGFRHQASTALESVPAGDPVERIQIRLHTLENIEATKSLPTTEVLSGAVTRRSHVVKPPTGTGDFRDS